MCARWLIVRTQGASVCVHAGSLCVRKDFTRHMRLTLNSVAVKVFFVHVKARPSVCVRTSALSVRKHFTLHMRLTLNSVAVSSAS